MSAISKWKWRLRQLSRRIWVPVAGMGLVGLVGSLGAAWLGRFLPEGVITRIGAEAVLTILQIIASSMLAVTTFSLSIMVSAFGSAASGATPRALTLLQQDRTTQRVLATFIGAFVYAIVGIIALQAHIYGDAGRFVLFLVTLSVIAVVIGMLLRWVQHLTNFGLLSDTIGRVERAAAAAMGDRCTAPFMGCAPWVAPPPGVFKISPERTGHVQHIDLAQLEEVATETDCCFWIFAAPGAFVHPAAPLVFCNALPGSAEARAEIEDAVRDAFTIDHGRSYDQDPRFGLTALAEIASRALSPAVNDPGTALDILGRLTRVLARWRPVPQPEVHYSRLHMSGLDPEALIGDAFDAIARDGAGLVEVALRLQEVLDGLARMAPGIFGPAARRQASRAARMAAEALPLPEDRERVAAIAAAVGEGS